MSWSRKGRLPPLTRNGLSPGFFDSPLTRKLGKNRAGTRRVPPQLRNIFWVVLLMKIKDTDYIAQCPVGQSSRSSLAEAAEWNA